MRLTGMSFPVTSMPIIIEHAYWQTPLFREICFGACLMLAVLLYRLRLFRLTRHLKIRSQDRLAERTRIAQELHDTLLQSFQGLILRFQIANETFLSDPFDAKKLLEQALDRADQALIESRRAIQGIRSVSPAGCELADSLSSIMNGLIEEICFGKTSLPITSVVVEGQPRTVNSWITEEACRIAKEALWNAFCHAHAQRMELEIAFSDKFLRVRFRDDGIGIDSEILRNGGRADHWGSCGMRERAKNIHGRLSVWSRAGLGTEVELTIPAFIAYDTEPSFRWSRHFPKNKEVQYDELH